MDEKSIAGILKLIALLGKCGNEIKMPYSKPVGEGLFELRKLGKRQVIIIYCFYNGEAFILHIFEKKNNRLSKADLDIAKHRQSTLA